MQQAARISDKTAFFLMGEVVEYDETKKIFNNPKEKKTQDYILGRFGWKRLNKNLQKPNLILGFDWIWWKA